MNCLPVPPVFAGRRVELGVLHDLYAAMRGGGHPGPMVIAVDGVSGVGKTALVLRFAHTVAADFPDGRVFLDLGQGSPVDPTTTERRLLLVLDDVRDAAQVRPLLPQSADSLVLITSRRPLTGLAASGGASLVEIERPGRAEAREILSAHLGVERDPAELDELAERCGRLPSALTLLAAQLRSTV